MMKYVTKNVLIVVCMGLLVFNGCLFGKVNSLSEKFAGVESRMTEMESQMAEKENPETDALLCPYCNVGLSEFSSSGTGASVAQLRCYNCGFRSPEVSIDKPNEKSKCLERCKEIFRNKSYK